MKNTLLFCNGLSGSGKTYFIQNTLPTGLFYNLRSATTRPMRDGESEGNPYFFRDEYYFDNTPLATHLWVNKDVWVPGEKKWMYGIPEFEIYNNLGQNLIYDVIEPQYTRQLMDWFRRNDLTRYYNFRVAYFLPATISQNTVAGRANMPNDTHVRQMNTCNPVDFLHSGVRVNYCLQPINGYYDSALTAHIKRLEKSR